MATAVVEIPEDVARELGPYRDRLRELLLLGPSQMKFQEAVLLYRRRAVSVGRAAKIAGLSEREFVQQARAFGIRPHWTPKMAEEELA